MRNRRFVIYSPPSDQNSGGVIALHRLCHTLNDIGLNAALCVYGLRRHEAVHRVLADSVRNTVSQVLSDRMMSVTARSGQRFRGFKTPLVRASQVVDSDIVVYPEVVSGNPLRASRVVRWFLFKPHWFVKDAQYGADELPFFYSSVFAEGTYTPYAGNLLRVVHLWEGVYHDANPGPRRGTCFMVRKGRGRPFIHDPSDAVQVDGLSHGQIARIMNRCEYFVSYDLYTMYSTYAVLCGCKSVVAPEPGLSKEMWQPMENLRYGIAYGFDDLPHAAETRDLVAGHLQEDVRSTRENVAAFADRCFAHFAR